MNPDVHISSLIIHTRPEQLNTVSHALARLPGCEVATQTPEGKIIVVLEATGTEALRERIDAVQLLPGVLNAAVVYHHCEPESELNEELRHADHAS